MLLTLLARRGSVVHVKDAGIWKPVVQAYVKDAAVWKPAQPYVKDAGVWK